MIKTVFIDFDDTLWDTKGNNKETLKELYSLLDWGRGYGSFDVFWEKYYPYNEHLWALYRHGEISKKELMYNRFAHTLAPVGITSEDDISEINSLFIGGTAKKTGVVEGAFALLEYLSSMYKVVILSNGFREVQRAKMTVSGIAPYIDHLVLSEDAGVSKPSKRIFDYAFSVTNSRPKETIMIGDSWEADIVGAQNARIPSIWFNPSGETRERDNIARMTPIYEVERLDQIPSLLRDMLPL
ncbi:YjjG family noncanonical pyrimidine nucleotidase [Porphyromonas sp.]|uniref:YjjG family noncanonical pyrimidine nucleotidase n=1 Tax=Porphyromonas sp. TaxID=1924944 RepID=UPI0026DC8B9F|nr:YjjG family noncanonical pyrimidine nucleotidase [Porphyromonas sp.]MDO4771224.1 YjjG family noncanonical pyrimidine nucleotidase [Porphyromonas sp.]